MAKKALLITDVTKCFGPDGELPVPANRTEAQYTIYSINSISEEADDFPEEWALIVISRDWHDDDSPHFMKWPKHGVKFTEGSEFYPGLKIRSDKIPVAIVSKGLGDVDGYSPFDPLPNVSIVLLMPNGNAYLWPGDLDSLAQRFNVDTFINTGWAKNYCVEAGCLAARKLGYKVYLPEDATNGIEVPNDPDNRIYKSDQRMRDAGVIFTTTDEVLR